MKNTDWISVKDRLPKEQGYYRVKFSDGSEDEKWYRLRPNRSGFLYDFELLTLTHWADIDQTLKPVYDDPLYIKGKTDLQNEG